jgi:N-acetylneuraminic acid mutarotase
MKWLNCEKIRLMLVVFVAVVVLGGRSAKADLTWTQKADMPTPRWTQTSAVVNGKIYVIGGCTSQPNARALATVEEYDPVTNTWTRKADAPMAIADMDAPSAVVDGKIYVIGLGGEYEVDWSLLTVQEYDPSKDTWTRKADMPTPRWMFATVDFEGKVYVIGGYPPNSWVGLKTVEVYDPATDTWTRKADMPLGVAILNTRVVRGKIYAIGGRPNLHSEPWMQEYDPATDTWTRKADMPVDTSAMGSVVLDDKIFVIGGWEWSMDYPYTTMQVYDPETDVWTREADVPFLRANFSAEVVNNRIYVIGGTDRPHPCSALSTVFESGPLVDFNSDGLVNISDLLMMIDNWGTDESLCDIGPTSLGDGVVDEVDLEALMSYWGQEIFPFELIAYWKLDEIEGDIAHDSVIANDADVFGGALWQPEGGIIDGAIELDGVDDYISTPFIINPYEENFSVFAWIKGGISGQVIISQQNVANWLLADPSEGNLITELKSQNRSGASLASQTVITDSDWYRVGLTWDGTNRILYVDDVEVASDTQSNVEGSESGLYIGTGKNLESGSFWSGLIDDVRIYNRAITP